MRRGTCEIQGGRFMIYVGVDIAKEKHFAVVMNTEQEILYEPFGFENNTAGFHRFLQVIMPFGTTGVVIGMESTSHYAETLISFLMDKGYCVAIINPLQTSALRKSAIRNTKNDKIDSKLIVKSMLVNGYKFLAENDVKLLHLKHLERFRIKLKKSITQQKIRLVAVMDVIFPEFQYFFKSGLHLRTSYEIIKKYTSPDDISKVHLTALTNLIEKASNHAFGKETAVALRELARKSVGTPNDILCLEAKQLIAQIELLEKQCDELDVTAAKLLESIDSQIKSIPRIGVNNASAIISEYGDLSNFSNPDQMTAYAGLDPVVKQSGKFNASGTRMSKRGSRYLRLALMNAAFQLTKGNRTFKNYYDKKRAEGKNHYNALGHTAHKLIRIIFFITKNNTPFCLP